MQWSSTAEARGRGILSAQVKERLKKTRQDKAVLKAADAKKGGSKAPKSAPARAVAKGARR
jgi:hypothetical protein